MTRKTTDDVAARNAAADMLIAKQVEAADVDLAINAFESVEFETVTTKVGGQPLELRRVVLTGPWEPVRK